MKAVHDALLAVTGFKRQVLVNDQLRLVTGPSSAGIGFDVWDGQHRITERFGPEPDAPVVVRLKLPYAVYLRSPGISSGRRLSGHRTAHSSWSSFRGIGVSEEQAEWVMEQLQIALDGRRLVVTGHKARLTTLEQSNRIFRDDEAVQPNGGPLFYGEDYYSTSVTLARARGAA